MGPSWGCTDAAGGGRCAAVDPDWEFRLFVVGGRPTALTVYDQTYYSRSMVEGQAAIERMVLRTWEEVKENIHRHCDGCV